MDNARPSDRDLPPIGAPATRALTLAGYTRLSQLTQVAAADLLKLHGVGPKAIRILREALAAQGLSFADGDNVAPKAATATPPNKDVDAYLAKLPADKQAALQKLRQQIHAAAPGTVETMSYGVPTFKLHGKMLVSIGAAKKHCALYGGAGDVVEANADVLKGFSVSKGTIRFTPEKPIPAALVKNLIKTRVAHIEAKTTRANNRGASAGFR